MQGEGFCFQEGDFRLVSQARLSHTDSVDEGVACETAKDWACDTCDTAYKSAKFCIGVYFGVENEKNHRLQRQFIGVR